MWETWETDKQEKEKGKEEGDVRDRERGEENKHNETKWPVRKKNRERVARGNRKNFRLS